MDEETQQYRPWIDIETSAQLPDLRLRGEGQDLEFKSELPEQAHAIAKSIAAFASSNDGRVIYGVRDDGEIVGIDGAADPKVRDVIERRISGAAREVRPPVHPSVTWAEHAGRVVCVVAVEKGFEALYYSNQRAIIRRGGASRPAEPGEVEDVFRRRYVSTSGTAPLPSTKEICGRLHRFLELLNQDRHEPLTVVDLARAMDLSSPAELDAVFEGRQAPTFAVLDQLCARFALDKEWLSTGRNQPFASPADHRARVAELDRLLERQTPEYVYLVRSKSDVGEAFLIAQADPLKFWRMSECWHVSDRVGGGGAADLLALYKQFKTWIRESQSWMMLGRSVEPSVAQAIVNGEIHPGIVENMPLSHWWDDLTDLEHKWTTREQSRMAYGKSFIAAQDILRRMLEEPARR
ncbi:MAG TPA: ATP-binding protein [Roseateles sp.]|uniref:AlbA family DNA-binding domain-containing protein n=1 Tax=Roseateles sp. TaxID=1971397 RepID=UPI002ED79DDA